MLMTPGEVTELSAQRVDARARLAVRQSGGFTRIERLYQEGAAKILRIQPGSLRARLSRAKAALRQRGDDDA